MTAPETPRAPDPAHGLAYLKGLNDTFEDKIKIADQKATLILSLIILMLVWSPELRSIYLVGLTRSGLDAALNLGVVAALTVSLISALLVVTPRDRRGGRALYWGAWPEARSEAIELATSSDPARLIESYADNAQNLAAISRSKYRFVSIAMWSLIVALAGHGPISPFGETTYVKLLSTQSLRPLIVRPAT